ncbi:MAG: potassium channel protein [Bacteroidales bacterium]|jgi:voltage-gated potassium channel|nr:potassium channel protein [Bacteroidales bacterium]
MNQLNKSEKFISDNIHGILVAFGILIGISVIGVIGYILIEGFNLIDAIYMTIITIATVGFREVAPLSPGGKIFTIVLIIMSFGVFAYVLSNFTRFIVNGVLKNYFKYSKMKKRINALSEHVIVVGYGRNGKQTMEELTAHGEQVVLIERKDELIEQIDNDTDYLFIQGDATQDEILSLAGIDRAKSLITALPVDADNLFVVLSARGLNSKIKIISRASEEHADIKLKRAGADNVIMPAKTGGQRMAKLVTQPDVVEFLDHVLLQTVNETSIEEVSCENLLSKMDNKTIQQLNIRKDSGANIIGLRRKDGSYLVNPKPDTIISCDDKILVLGEKQQIQNMKDLLSKA